MVLFDFGDGGACFQSGRHLLSVEPLFLGRHHSAREDGARRQAGCDHLHRNLAFHDVPGSDGESVEQM